MSYPQLYDISMAPYANFAQVVEADFHTPFRRRFTPVMLEQWNAIKGSISVMQRSHLGHGHLVPDGYTSF
jgi:hypothetical protein